MSLKNQILTTGKDLGIKNAIIELVIRKITGYSKSQLFLKDDIEEKYTSKIIENLQKIQLGIPLEYILENAEFYGLDYYVDTRVLIPRNDTECIVDEALNNIGSSNIFLIDVGTGSSCIAISIIKNSYHIPQAYVIDISEQALEVSKINIKKHGLENTIIQLRGDLLTPILKNKKNIRSKNIIITANLPYIKNGDLKNIDNNVIFYEPNNAIYGGKNTGFELYEKLITQCLKLKKLYGLKNLILFIEIGFDQYEYSQKYISSLGLIFKYFKDNSGIWRCIKIVF